MHPVDFILQLVLASVVLTTPLYSRYAENSTSATVDWSSCPFNGSLPINCGSLVVPLDYTDPHDNEKVRLDLVRVPAAKTPSKGSILFNFGGPGYEARQTLATLAIYLQGVTGGYHDLIAFDARGTGAAMAYSCFENDVERTIATASYPLTAGDASEVALGQLWANSKVLANYCYANAKNISEMVGTAFVARDLMQVVDALGEDGMLRYWGFSYGSVLGETVAAMFPNRMDKVILDGVVNGHNYYHKTGIDIDQLSAADDTFTAVLGECIKAGDLCALSHLNSTVFELQATLWELANDIKAAPITIGTVVIDYSLLLSLYYISVKTPSLFQTAASLIKNILEGQNLETLPEFLQELRQSIIGTNPEALYGIKGSDTIPRHENLVGVLPDIQYLEQTSHLFWGLAAAQNTMQAQWPFMAKEIYRGDFVVRTPNPILFIGNTWDPATPIASARNMSKSFEGSVVLEQHGFGHSSLSQTSTCTAKIISDYFIDGILPAANTICEVDSSLFI